MNSRILQMNNQTLWINISCFRIEKEAFSTNKRLKRPLLYGLSFKV
jgi:hypothetical protein